MKKLSHIFLILCLILEIIGGILKLAANNLFGVFILSGLASAFIWGILDSDLLRNLIDKIAFKYISRQ